MTKTLTRVRKWIAERLYPIDLVDLTRSQITRVDRESSLGLELMNKEETEAILSFAHSVASNKFFNQIVDPLVFCEIDFIARFSKTPEESVLARGTINGMERVKEEFERLSNAYSEIHSKDIFNKFDVV